MDAALSRRATKAADVVGLVVVGLRPNTQYRFAFRSLYTTVRFKNPIRRIESSKDPHGHTRRIQNTLHRTLEPRHTSLNPLPHTERRIAQYRGRDAVVCVAAGLVGEHEIVEGVHGLVHVDCRAPDGHLGRLVRGSALAGRGPLRR